MPGDAVQGNDGQPVAIVGAGGHGRVILDAVRSAGGRVLGFLDDGPSMQGREISGVRVLGGLERASSLARDEGAAFIVGIGDNVVRGRVIRQLLEWGLPLASAVHARAVVAPDVVVGAGVVVMPGAVVNTGSSLGLGVVVNTSASLDHDNELMEGAHAMPGATLAGAVVLGRYATVGSGAVVLPGVRIGDNAYVGAGAVAREDVMPDTVVVGVPARFLKRQESLPF